MNEEQRTPALRGGGMREPVAWIPVGVQWPFEDLDILFSDGSVLMSVIPQVDGDFWWRGGGAGERFFDPAYSEVTHWRPHVAWKVA